jgi:hypothetical protein
MSETTEIKENLIREANVKFADLYDELDAKISTEIKDEDLARLVKVTIAEPISQIRHGDHPFKNSQSIDEAVKAMKEDLLQTVIPERIEEDKIAHATAAKAIDAFNKAKNMDDVNEAINETSTSWFPNEPGKEERIVQRTMEVLAQKYFDFKSLEDKIADKESFKKIFNSYAYYDSREANMQDNLQQRLNMHIRTSIMSFLDYNSYLEKAPSLKKTLSLAWAFYEIANFLPEQCSSAVAENKSMQAVVRQIGVQKGIVPAY